MLYTDSELYRSLDSYWNVHPGSDMNTSLGCWAFCTGGQCLSDLGSTYFANEIPAAQARHLSCLPLSLDCRVRQLRLLSLEKGKLQRHHFITFHT